MWQWGSTERPKTSCTADQHPETQSHKLCSENEVHKVIRLSRRTGIMVLPHRAPRPSYSWYLCPLCSDTSLLWPHLKKTQKEVPMKPAVFILYVWGCSLQACLCIRSTGWRSWWDRGDKSLCLSNTPQSSHQSPPTSTKKVFFFSVIWQICLFLINITLPDSRGHTTTHQAHASDARSEQTSVHEVTCLTSTALLPMVITSNRVTASTWFCLPRPPCALLTPLRPAVALLLLSFSNTLRDLLRRFCRIKTCSITKRETWSKNCLLTVL